jgi:hypothetical protein
VVGLIAPLRPPAGARARRLRLLALADQGKEAAEPLGLEDGRLSDAPQPIKGPCDITKWALHPVSTPVREDTFCHR